MQVLPGVLSSFRPQLVLYDAGVDVHVDDELGRLSVSDKGEGGTWWADTTVSSTYYSVGCCWLCLCECWPQVGDAA
jgi:acetoin utilization deacetylase AcuC-like enzyme